MIDLKDISIITHIRLDNKDRLENLILRNRMLKSLSKNAQYIIVEDDSEEKLKSEMEIEDDYGFIENHASHVKNSAYNMGASMSDRKYMIFLDADCIIHPKIFKQLTKSNSSIFDGLVYPYNRYALYMSPSSKMLLKKNFSYDTLDRIRPKGVIAHGMNGECGHLYANCPGGSFMMTHEVFNKVNGFNPAFRGWGYEDTEFVTRINRLGLPMATVGGDENMMFHLHHGDVSKGDTHARGKFLGMGDTQNNKAIYEKLAAMTKVEAEQYSKGWVL